jgi:hypothetical protein
MPPAYNMGVAYLGGLFTLQKRLWGDGILHVDMLHYFKIPYFTCTIFQNLPTMNILDPIFYRTLFLKFSPVNSPRVWTRIVAMYREGHQGESTPPPPTIFWLILLFAPLSGMEVFQTFYSPLLSWTSPYFSSLDLVIVGLAHIFQASI